VSSVTSDPTLDATTSRPDTSHFNGLQTTGRDYRNLSPAEHAMNRDVDQAVPYATAGGCWPTFTAQPARARFRS
jgi:hypothetical protein